jgi:hypothetical protein
MTPAASNHHRAVTYKNVCYFKATEEDKGDQNEKYELLHIEIVGTHLYSSTVFSTQQKLSLLFLVLGLGFGRDHANTRRSLFESV